MARSVENVGEGDEESLRPAATGVTPAVEDFDGPPEEWDGALPGLDASSFCHLHGWRAVMRDALGHETRMWVARDAQGRICGALPLVRVKSRLFGDFLMSMPFLNYGGPAGDSAAAAALAARAVDVAGELGVDLLELRRRESLQVPGMVRSDRKLTVVKALPSSSEELWEKGLKAKVRSQVRRPMKEGMTVRFGLDQVKPFYQVFSTTMRDLGTPVLPEAFFESIAEHLSEHVMFAIVEWNGLPVAAGCGFHWNGEFEITWAGSSREHARQAPNMLLYWGMMEESVRLGYTAFNFGRCTPDSGTHRFKRQWGGEDEPLPWLQWTSGGVSSTPDPDSAKFRLAIRVWQKLPVAAATLIGARVSPFLP